MSGIALCDRNTAMNECQLKQQTSSLTKVPKVESFSNHLLTFHFALFVFTDVITKYKYI